MLINIGSWYKSKRGHLCRAELLHQDGSVTVISHFTGNKILLDPEQVSHLRETDQPDTPIGSPMLGTNTKTMDDHTEVYAKYRHIVPDSIYKSQSTHKVVEEKFEADGKLRVKTTKSGEVGATRCKIKCQTPKCKNTRDIKVQDAWVTKYCEVCMKIRRKESLKKFLKNKKNKK